MEVGWPSELWIVRHAESAGNVARARALAEGATLIDLDLRDCDVPLSELGESQAEALGRWCGRYLEPLDAVITSPYARAQETATIALRASQWPTVPVVLDERLREKEFGALDKLTAAGIQERYPEQAVLRSQVGKFYYRPPGGESWTDVILRLRSLTEMLTRQYAGKRVAIVSHQVIVLCFRYLLENLTEAELLTIDHEGDVANCGVTSYRYDPDSQRMVLLEYNAVAPMEESGAPVTSEPDVPLAR